MTANVCTCPFCQDDPEDEGKDNEFPMAFQLYIEPNKAIGKHMAWWMWVTDIKKEEEEDIQAYVTLEDGTVKHFTSLKEATKAVEAFAIRNHQTFKISKCLKTLINFIQYQFD